MYLYFFLITLIILIILFNNTIREKFSISNESVQSIYSVFLKQYLSLENINKLIFFNNNNVNIVGVLNAKNNFMIADTDIRQYLTGCILISMNPNNASLENGGNKRTFQQGLYILNNDYQTVNDPQFESSFNNKADIIIVFPGFGVYALEKSLFTNAGEVNTSTDLGQYIKIENYGKNPIKINLKDGSIIASNNISNSLPPTINILPTNITYGEDSNAYKIIRSPNFTDLSKNINAINVYLLPMSVWNKHIAP
jgi:hypothetical protein